MEGRWITLPPVSEFRVGAEAARIGQGEGAEVSMKKAVGNLIHTDANNKNLDASLECNNGEIN